MSWPEFILTGLFAPLTPLVIVSAIQQRRTNSRCSLPQWKTRSLPAQGVRLTE